MLFPQQQEQLASLKKHHDDEIEYHERELRRHEEEIKRLHKRVKEINDMKSSGSDSD